MRQCTQNIELESNNLSCKEHGAVLNEHCWIHFCTHKLTKQ
jgi:hypothetical protein